MKFGKNSDKKNEVVDTDRRWPFFGHLANRSTDKKTYSDFYFLVIWDHGFYCGTLKLLDGN